MRDTPNFKFYLSRNELEGWSFKLEWQTEREKKEKENKKRLTDRAFLLFLLLDILLFFS